MSRRQQRSAKNPAYKTRLEKETDRLRTANKNRDESVMSFTPYDELQPPSPEEMKVIDERLDYIFNRLRWAHEMDERDRLLAMKDSPYAP